MIYKNDVLIVWDGKRQEEYTPDEARVRAEILEIRNKYFADNTLKKVCLLYPNGKPKQEDGGGFAVLKMFPIPLNSADGQWRWTANTKTKKGYTDSHRYVKHSTILHPRDIEFVWFLMNRSSVLNRYIVIEDLEADARTEITSMSTDADIIYMLTSPRSPIAKDEKLVRELADIFNIKDADKIGLYSVKSKLLAALKEGNQNGDKFTNYEKFDEFVEGSNVREAAFITRTAIASKEVGYKDRAWWIMSGTSYEEQLMKVNAKDAAYKEQVLIDEVVKNSNIRDRLYSALGVEQGVTIDKLRELDRNSLRRKLKELTGKDHNVTKEELIAAICKEHEIEYTEI